MKKLIWGIHMLLFLSCSSCIQYVEKPIKPFPKKPAMQSFSRNPIISAEGKNFWVTDEFVTRATQEHEYLKAILSWREENGIPYSPPILSTPSKVTSQK